MALFRLICTLLLFRSIFAILHTTYDKYYMDSYCSPSSSSSSSAVSTNSKTQSAPSTSSSNVITLGREWCTSVANLRAYRTDYPNNVKCEISIKSPAGYGIIAQLKYAAFRPTLSCLAEKDELVIALNKTSQQNITSSGKLDVFTEPTDSDIQVVFVATNIKEALTGKGFDLTFTTYRPLEASGSCSDGYFNCENTRCIHNGLRCDKVDNCGNNQDENGCDYGVRSVWLLLAISGWLFSGFVVIGIFICFAYQKYMNPIIY